MFYTTLLPVIQEQGEASVFETTSPTDAFTFSAKAVSGNYDLIVAAGGDGTISQVVNGMLATNVPAAQLPMLSILPMGSGNDFARTVNSTTNPAELRQRLANKNPRLLDIGSVTYALNGETRHAYFINVASAGMGPEVLSTMATIGKRWGAAVRYYAAILKTFFSYRCIPVTIKTGGWEWSNSLRTLAIGNGKYFGNGLCIAPGAKPDDGLFSAFVCGNVSVFDFARYSSTLKRGKKVNHPKIEYRAANVLQLTSAQPCRMEADGELLGMLPAVVKIIPARVKFL